LLRYGLSHLAFNLFQFLTMIFSGHMSPYLLGKISVFGALPYILVKRRQAKQLRKVQPDVLRSQMTPNWIRLHFARGFLNP
jgi:hypothetical protein